MEQPTQISSLAVVEGILAEHFGIVNAKINRTTNGKPYIESPKRPLYFSVTHTKELLFIAFSDKNIGMDAELLNREVAFQSILRRFSTEEKEEIHSTEDFLRHWIVKESAIKWLGGTIAHDLEKLSYINGILRYEQADFPARITNRLFEKHILSICSERDFSNAQFVHYIIQTK